jgi:hypothetical protein
LAQIANGKARAVDGVSICDSDSYISLLYSDHIICSVSDHADFVPALSDDALPSILSFLESIDVLFVFSDDEAFVLRRYSREYFDAIMQKGLFAFFNEIVIDGVDFFLSILKLKIVEAVLSFSKFVIVSNG